MARKKTIGERIKQARLELELTQDEVAEESGITKAAISRIETNKVTNPTCKTALAIADSLEVSLLWLVTGVRR